MRSRWWYWLLVLPFAGTLCVPLFTRSTPQAFGFPFFYWYQILWIPLSAVLAGIVYVATKRVEHE